VAVIAWRLAMRSGRAVEDLTTLPPVIDDNLRAESRFPPAEALQCGSCHKQQFDDWLNSQHAHANRLIQPASDFSAFKGGAKVKIGAHETRLYRDGDELLFLVREPDDSESLHRAEAVIGVAPLIQYLVTAPGGRLQAIDTAWDVERHEFFNVFGEERFAHEWGYWRNRAMTWNIQCAFCHMTGLERNYDAASDRYRTTWRAMGISCTQCHGQMPQHRANPSAPVETAENLSASQKLDNCASCHSRREELTTEFAPGENYLDHFRPILVDTANYYYEDGQVREENFEYGSFLMSRMHHKGVTCLDCHEPHSGKLLLPAENNAMCMLCHGGTGSRGAIPIPDTAAHSHHKVGSTGDRCIECHMPVTHYMQRDPRRDHGFTMPDPLLTRELGIPNACNRCHTDKSTDWAVEWSERWYGEKLKRRSRERARIVARARAQDPMVVPQLLEMARTEEIAAWRASLVGLLGFAAAVPDVSAFLRESAFHPDPLVRAAAARASDAAPAGASISKRLQSDPVRLVRLDAAWTTLARGGGIKPELQTELQNYIEATWEQPQGAARAAQLALIEHRPADAESWMRKAAAWDGSVASKLMLAHTLHAIGKSADAVQVLRDAIRLDAGNAEARYMLALLLGELGEKGEVLDLLRKTVELDPHFDRAWYNLGLALAESGDLPGSIEALSRAEKSAPSSPDAPYALATVLARAGRLEEAREAARDALRRVPDYSPAKEFLEQLP
jgi:tetratricopeptide (TPR) repeat protein